MKIIMPSKSELIECKCDKCGTVLHVHPACNAKSPWITDCKLHKKDKENSPK